VRAQPARDAIGRRRLRRAGAWWSVCAVSGALPRPPGPTRVGDDGDDDARSHTGRRTRDGGGRVSARRRGRLNAKNHLGPKGNYGGYAFCSQFLAHDMCVCHRCRLVRVVSLHARRGGASVARAARRSERAARRARTGRLRMARSLDAPPAPPRPFGWLVSRHAPTATATAGGGRAASSRVACRRSARSVRRAGSCPSECMVTRHALPRRNSPPPPTRPRGGGAGTLSSARMASPAHSSTWRGSTRCAGGGVRAARRPQSHDDEDERYPPALGTHPR
jgi:hypothetical protein